MNKVVVSFCVLMILTLVGCGKGYIPMSGKVTFPDGKPLTKGTVTFSTESFMARGPLNELGEYKLSSLNPGDGLPPGSYTVRIEGAVENIDGKTKGPGGAPMLQQVSIIENNFSTNCDVVPGTKVFDFEVPYPAK